MGYLLCMKDGFEEGLLNPKVGKIHLDGIEMMKIEDQQLKTFDDQRQRQND